MKFCKSIGCKQKLFILIVRIAVIKPLTWRFILFLDNVLFSDTLKYIVSKLKVKCVLVLYFICFPNTSRFEVLTAFW